MATVVMPKAGVLSDDLKTSLSRKVNRSKKKKGGKKGKSSSKKAKGKKKSKNSEGSTEELSFSFKYETKLRRGKDSDLSASAKGSKKSKDSKKGKGSKKKGGKNKVKRSDGTEVSFEKLNAGTYFASYRVLIINKNKVVGKTNWSPEAGASNAE